MANKKVNTTGEAKRKEQAETEPKFPYTTKPSSLRKLLQQIPAKPKPQKFDMQLLKSWGFRDANDHSVIRVLKEVGLLGSGNAPTELYSRFMQLNTGSAALADPIRSVYGPLFTASHTPYQETNETLQNLFNIHSGGGQRTLDLQIQTFKALCDSASFDAANAVSDSTSAASMQRGKTPLGPPRTDASDPVIHINLHIHLPENKSKRDYEALIEDIGKYIFGRAEQGHRDE